MRKFSEFATNESRLDGDKLSIKEVLGKAIVVKNYKIIRSCIPGKQCLDLQFEKDGELYVLFTNSSVLMRQIEQYKNELPFETVIKRTNQYYTFS